jgi:chemotaxis protein CheC
MEHCQEPITSDEKDILQEIMNIAFGQAAADLAEVINIFVVLSVPCVETFTAAELPGYLREQVSEYGSISILEQNFWGDFKGSAFMMFRADSGRELVAIFGEENDIGLSHSMDALEQETLMEVGNILIGACVGKLAELLGDMVTYSPPRVIIDKIPADAIPANAFDANSSAIVLKTLFCFNERNVEGFLFLVTSHDSIVWLKKALATFMEQYE